METREISLLPRRSKLLREPSEPVPPPPRTASSGRLLTPFVAAPSSVGDCSSTHVLYRLRICKVTLHSLAESSWMCTPSDQSLSIASRVAFVASMHFVPSSSCFCLPSIS